MFTEPDDTIRQLQHQKNVWRGIAIGLAATFVLLLVLGGIAGLVLATRTQRAIRAEEVMRALQERDRAEAEARRAAKAQRP